jgi:hypothetical protein
MAGLTNYAEDLALDAVFAGTLYIGLFSVTPTDAYTSGSPDGTEASGGGYARASATFDAASGGATANTGVVTFTESTGAWASGASLPYFGVFTAASGGSLIGYGTLTTARTVDAAGITLSFAAGALDITQD